MRIAHINVVPNLSTGRIAASICRLAIHSGHGALLCYSRYTPPSDIPTYRIGGRLNTLSHLVMTRLTDRAGFFSHAATKKLIRQLEKYKPDLIHLHNLHGYYLNLPMLFDYLKTTGIPVVWTLHDCWAYTGHCAYYATAKADRHLSFDELKSGGNFACTRWRKGCHHCPQKRQYPSTWLIDASAANWKAKRELFSGLEHMVLVTPSEWLRQEVEKSFLNRYAVYTFPNGLDLQQFQPCGNEDYLRVVLHAYHLDQIQNRKLIVSAASVWEERKGLDDLVVLADELGRDYCILAVGLDENQIQALPQDTIMGFPRTDSIAELCALYTVADLYLSTSSEETMGMTLLEALACGTQVLCYKATAMPEIVTEEVGETVPLWDISALADAARRLCDNPKSPENCRKRAMDYEANQCYGAYIRLYEKIEAAQPPTRPYTRKTLWERLSWQCKQKRRGNPKKSQAQKDGSSQKVDG